ncbi:MAG: hypothetical protein JWO57_2213 [Pseudonocardiales bacterium]|nr:hypothetical protein [Pseudonocardiales bacterium]
MSTPELVPHRQQQQQGGPPLGVLAVVSAVLFLIGLFAAAVVAKGFPPAPTATAATIEKYFHDHRSAARVSALFQFAAAVPLALYAATASARLRNLGIRAPGATIALAGGLLSAAFLAVSALTSWVLSRAEVVSDPTLVRAFQDLGYITGGPGHVVFLGLLVAGIAVPALFTQLLPRPVVFVGLLFAAIAELSTLSIATDKLAVLLPIARFPILIWLIVAGFQLPHTRQRQKQ